MRESKRDDLDRRTVLKLLGASGLTAGIAGCVGGDDDGGGDDDDSSGDGSGDDSGSDDGTDGNLPVIVPDGLIDSSLPGEVGNPMNNVWGTAPAATGPSADRFAELYQEEWGSEPGVFNAHAYDAAALVVLANARAGENDGVAIRDSMRAIANPGGEVVTANNLAEGLEMAAQGTNIQYQGASSICNFDENGDMQAVSYDVNRYQDGEIETIRTLDFGESSDGDGSSGGGGSGGGGEMNREIKYGVLMPETGDLGSLGVPIRDGARLVARQLEGETSFTFDVGTADTQTDPQAGISSANSLVDSGYPAVVGPAASNVNLQVTRQSFIPNEVVGISPSSTAPAVTNLDDSDYIFRTAPSDALQGPVIAQVAAEDLEASSTSTMFLNDAYGQALEEAFVNAFESEQGGEILERVSFEPQQPSYSSQLDTAIGADPDFLFIVGFPQSGIQLFRDFYSR
jgi:branched-chain amino acid transport system substrate-binding protein